MAVQEFISPTSLSEAQQAVGDGSVSSWLAGGTDLLVGIRLGARDPARVIDLKQIPELTAIEIDDASVRIGAAASAFDVLHNSDVPSLFPGLAEALNLIGSTQITGRCSAGGNLCNASPAADSIPALIANGAQCRILGPEGERALAVEDFVVGPNRNALAPGELLVELILPRPAAGTSDAYLRLTPRTEMDIAVAGAGVSITVDESRHLHRCEGGDRCGGTYGVISRGCGSGTGGFSTKSSRDRRSGCGGARRGNTHLRQARHGRVPYSRGGGVGIAGHCQCTGLDYGGSFMNKPLNKMAVQATINGESTAFLCAPGQVLAEVLRDELELIGTKIGCNTGDCGACSVLVDDRLVCSCLVLAAEIEGKSVQTVEGVANGGELHPLQQKLLEHGGLQCGICTPGVVMAAKALLEHNPDPTEEQTRYWLAGNLCRCTGYDKIIRAVLDAAKTMRGEAV
jgi:xanthine dehydrogenase iron-sulfur cluster and FAD-binding subunit A